MGSIYGVGETEAFFVNTAVDGFEGVSESAAGVEVDRDTRRPEAEDEFVPVLPGAGSEAGHHCGVDVKGERGAFHCAGFREGLDAIGDALKTVFDAA